MLGHVDIDLLHGFQSINPLSVKMGQNPVKMIRLLLVNVCNNKLK